VFLTPDDIVEVKSKMVMMYVASLWNCSLTIGMMGGVKGRRMSKGESVSEANWEKEDDDEYHERDGGKLE
jgi:hypothetical protein